MKLIEILKKLGLFCWHIVLIGWERGWITRNDMIDCAVQLLSEGKDEGDENLAAIAAGEYYTEVELREFVISYIEKHEKIFLQEDMGDSINKWRLAHLLAIKESKVSDEDKICQLQDAYAEFDYPPDMESCSIYAQDNLDPLVAMENVIEKLRNLARCN